MEFTDIFRILADYFNFSVDFAQSRGLEPFVLKGLVDPTLFSFFVVGLVLAYAIGKIKELPAYAGATANPASSASNHVTTPEGVDTVSLGALTLLGIILGVLYHWYMVGFARVFDLPLRGNVKDTLNALLAFNALFNPFNAIWHRILAWLKARIATKPPRPILILIMILIVAMIGLQLGALYYLTWCIATLQGLTFRQLLWPVLSFSVLSVIGVYVLLGALMWRDIFPRRAAA